jgi:hypothetical protein
MKVFGITGWKNTGKTTLTERLVAELTGQGLRVSTVKHAHHETEIDHPGRDSFRHRQAGAGTDEADFAAQDVPDLRQFIQRMPPHPAPQTRHTRIADQLAMRQPFRAPCRMRQQMGQLPLGAAPHAAQFPHPEQPPIAPDAVLRMERRTATDHQQADQPDQQRCPDRRRQRHNQQIEPPLCGPAPRRMPRGLPADGLNQTTQGYRQGGGHGHDSDSPDCCHSMAQDPSTPG